MSFIRGSSRFLSKYEGQSELKKSISTTCPTCLQQFDGHFVFPFMVGPCQHLSCLQCIDQIIFKDGPNSQCHQCSVQIERQGVKESNLMVNILNDLKRFYGCSEEQLPKLERTLAEKYQNDPNLQCSQCGRTYDMDNRPVSVCKDHLCCEECLQMHGFKNSVCPIPPKGHDRYPNSQLYFCSLAMKMLEYTYRILYRINLRFIDKEREFRLNVAETISIKNVVHRLQEHQLLPPQLQIDLCKFYIHIGRQREMVSYKDEMGLLAKRTQSQNRERQTVNIEIEYDESAIKEGKVTQSSKIIDELPMKMQNSKSSPLFVFESIQQDQENECCIVSFKKKEVQFPQFQKQQGHKQLPKTMAPLTGVKDRFTNQLKLPTPNPINASPNLPKKPKLPTGTRIEDDKIYKVITSKSEGERKQIFERFVRKSEMKDEDEEVLCHMMERTLNKPFTAEQLNKSKEMESKIKAESAVAPNQNSKAEMMKNTLNLILLVMKTQLQQGGIEVIFTPQSSLRSQLTLKLLTTHFINDRVKIRQTMDDDFEQIYESTEKLSQFIAWQKKRLASMYELELDDIVIHDIIKGSTIFEASTTQAEQIVQNCLKSEMHQKIELHPFFKFLELSPQDFTNQGYIKFKSSKNDVQFRGNWPYYQPINCVRYGIKVRQAFENMIWLQMKNVPGEWPSAFHGVKNPNEKYENQKNVINSIMNGLKRPDRKMLRVDGDGQARKANHCKRDSKVLVGTGAYVTPHFHVAAQYAKSTKALGKSYNLVFQCRLHPDHIKITSRQDYWVINKSEFIRPYGIILIEESFKKTYPKPKQQFKQEFTYEKYKARIEHIKIESLSNSRVTMESSKPS